MARVTVALLGSALMLPMEARALPTGYVVWSHGDANDPASRAIYRMTLPGKIDLLQLTASEAVECKISPDGQWVAYARAKLPGGTDYHDYNFWRLYVVSIHGTGDGREENLIDDNGYWPSWGADGKLYYSQVDGNHTRVMRATLDAYGRRVSRDLFFDSASLFATQVPALDECFVAPGADWFAARIRQVSEPGVAAFTVTPPELHNLATAGSKGCMPVVSPDGAWSLIAGAGYGILWGESPLISNRITNQLLIPPRTASGQVYHPGFASDGNWVMAAHSQAQDHNQGPYDIYIYEIDGRSTVQEELLLENGFNGWPDLWVGLPSDPPPPIPTVDTFFPSSYTITSGSGPVTLTWETRFADGATLNGSNVAVDGSTSVSPDATTTYTLVARQSLHEEAAATVACTVTVHATAQAVVIDSFAVEPSRITAGDIATLSWQVTDPTTLEIDGERIAPSGARTVEPLHTKTYLLTAHGEGGPQTAEVTLTVESLERIADALLDDRGGCMCGARGDNVLLVAFALAGAWLRRRG